MYQKEDSNATRSLVATILAEFAENDVALLVDLLETSTPENFKYLLPKLQPYKSVALARLYQRLDEELQPEWNDVRNSRWVEPRAAIIRQIEEAQGIVRDRFAFAQSLPFDKFAEIAEDLVPVATAIRFRPYRMKASLQPA